MGDSFFVTDVDVNNAGDSTATYQVLWLPRGEDNAEPLASDEVMIEPGQSVRWKDVLGTVFGVTDGAPDFQFIAGWAGMF